MSQLVHHLCRGSCGVSPIAPSRLAVYVGQSRRGLHSRRGDVAKDAILITPRLKGSIVRGRGPKRGDHQLTSDQPLLSSALHTNLLYSSVVHKHRNLFATRNAQGMILNFRAENRSQVEHLRRVVELREEQNFSVALKQIYGGVAHVQDHRSIVPHEILVQDQVQSEESREEQVVFPLGLVQSTNFSPPLLEEGEIRDDRDDGSNLHSAPSQDDTQYRKRSELGRRPRRGGRRSASGPTTDFDEESRSEHLLANDQLFRYGTPDPQIPASDVPCGGCGALLHCNDPKLAGYTPSESFRDKSREQLRMTLCERCRIMKTYNLALKLNVDKESYPRLIRQQLGHNAKAIVLLVVDLLDCPGSLRDDIVALLGFNKRIILVGNKVDLIPQDSSDYLGRIETSMREAFQKKCNANSLIKYDISRIDSALVSARTGFNVEHLISKIFKSWNEMGQNVGRDIFIVGTTNVGKSSIFNMLLESDLCKVKAIHKVEKAMTSPVPGTTLNLLKFPLMRPDPSRIYQRVSRLTKSKSIFNEEERRRLKLLRSTADPKYATRRGSVGLSFYDKSDKFHPLTSGLFDMKDVAESDINVPARLDPMHPDFASGKWCYDTPGTLTEDQLVDLLTQEELPKALPEHPIRPRSFQLKLGHTLFLGGVARLDLLEGTFQNKTTPIVTTIFASDSLPVNIVRSVDAQEFYERNLKHEEIMSVPCGGPRRMSKWPQLAYKQFEMDSISQFECSADIVIGSIGWITLCPPVSTFITVNVWTPGAKGLWLREPCFLPFAHLLKGRKLAGSLAFANDGVFVQD